MLRGNFELQLNNKMKTNQKIEKFAGEPVAFHLHKKRDFLDWLLSNKKELKQVQKLQYQNLLKELANL